METKTKITYEPPIVEVVELVTEGVMEFASRNSGSGYTEEQSNPLEQ